MSETSSETTWAIYEELTPAAAQARIKDSGSDVFPTKDGRFLRVFCIGKDRETLERERQAPLPPNLTILTDPLVVGSMTEYFKRRSLGSSAVQRPASKASGAIGCS